MKRPKMGIGVLRPLILGILAGGLATTCLFLTDARLMAIVLSEDVRQREVKQLGGLRDDLYDPPCTWCYLKVDENGWSATSIYNSLQLKERLNTTDKEIVIPIYPTVYEPATDDDLYYNTILESDIEQGDKVLVIGAGSGSDAWAAWLKSQSLVYVIEVNPLAIANINATACLGNFQVKPILGDIRDIDLPEDFSEFDFVLWNMPYLYPDEEGERLEERNFHDGDDGSILRSFLELLPSILKKDGQVIIINTTDAMEFIKFPNLTTKGSGSVLVYIFSNAAA
jgi:tRNA1(Val) A37 N6-methylase TrmN6